MTSWAFHLTIVVDFIYIISDSDKNLWQWQKIKISFLSKKPISSDFYFVCFNKGFELFYLLPKD